MVSFVISPVDLARRVVARYLGETVITEESQVPVRNRETSRIVYVLPDTLRDEPERFERITPDEADPHDTSRRPRRPAKPKKPRKPYWHRDPIPIPVRYLKPPQPLKRIKPVPLVKPVKPVPIPEPPRPRHYPLIPGRTQYKEDG